MTLLQIKILDQAILLFVLTNDTIINTYNLIATSLIYITESSGILEETIKMNITFIKVVQSKITFMKFHIFVIMIIYLSYLILQ